MDETTIEAAELIATARNLLGDMPDNDEYDRGIIDLLAKTLDIQPAIVRAFLETP